MSVAARMVRIVYSRLPGSGAVILIADSGMLMGEVMQSSRPAAGSPGRGRITSLLWALHRQGAVLLLPRHVLDEVERDLPRRAGPADDVDLAYRRLRTLYLPRARIVDVPAGWAEGDPRVEAVAARHPVDVPAARLAVALGYSFLLTEDPDLCDPPGLGFAAWLQVTHAAANETEVETIYVAVSIPVTAMADVAAAASRRIAAASPGARLAMLGGLLILGAAGVWWVRSGRAGQVLERVRPAARELCLSLGPPLAETFGRYQRGQAVFAQAAVPPASTVTLAERTARVLALRSSPALAEDIARKLGTPGNLRARTGLVRAELRGTAAFTEVSRGRWMLGTPSGYQPAPLPALEVVDYMERLHKNTARRP